MAWLRTELLGLRWRDLTVRRELCLLLVRLRGELRWCPVGLLANLLCRWRVRLARVDRHDR